MGDRLTKEELERIREVRIHAILGLTDDGRRVMVRCPMHGEKRASFVIYPDNSFKCFGCGVYGNGAIDFVTKLGYDFVDSLEELVKYI